MGGTSVFELPVSVRLLPLALLLQADPSLISVLRLGKQIGGAPSTKRETPNRIQSECQTKRGKEKTGSLSLVQRTGFGRWLPTTCPYSF
jgi:hypothetical protein